MLNKLLIKSIIFPAYLGIFHILIIILIGIFGKYSKYEAEKVVSVGNLNQYASKPSSDWQI